LSEHFMFEPVQPAQRVISNDGPAQKFTLVGSNTQLGLISPHSHNFCGSCNRVRLTAEGRLLLCLGNEHSVDLKAVVRDSDDIERQKSALRDVIIEAMQIKPESHHFDLSEQPQIVRFMNMTGG